MMHRVMILSQFVVLATTATLHAQTAKVMEVNAATTALVKSNPPLLLVGAQGSVSDAGWKNARLVPYVYVVPPEDGIWDFDFVANRVPGPHTQVVTPIFAFEVITQAPEWVKGIRVHSSTNSKETTLAKEIRFDATARTSDARSGSISLEGRYEPDGAQHCLVAVAKVKVGTINEEYELGRFCIGVGGNCISGEKGLGDGVKLHWKLCIEDGGGELCLYAKACKDFGFPIGEQCTPEGSVRVDIPRSATN